MKKGLALSMLVLLLGTMLFIARAQDAPSSMNLVLADLSARVGQTVTVNDLDIWTFEQQVFPDSSLGCPQPNQVYSQVQTVGLQYTLVYEGVTYDYRVSNDGSQVVLCSQSETTPPCPPLDSVGYLPPRLTIGGQGRVGVGGIPNNVREQPGSSSKLLGEIPSEGVFNVLAGPTCSTLDKVVWWQVDYNGLVGWTAESKDGEYYVEPVVLPGTLVPTAPPTLMPTPAAVSPVIDPSNAAMVTLLSNPEGGSGAYALSLDGQVIAVAQTDGTVIFYDVDTNVASPPLAAHTGVIAAMAFSTNPEGSQRLFFTGGSDGPVRVWDATDTNAVALLAELTGVEGRITAVDYSVVGQIVAAGNDGGSIYLFSLADSTLLATLTGGESAVIDLTFSTNGTTFMALYGFGEARVWGIPVAIG